MIRGLQGFVWLAFALITIPAAPVRGQVASSDAGSTEQQAAGMPHPMGHAIAPLPPPRRPALGRAMIKDTGRRLLTLEGAERSALENNPTLAQAAAGIRAASGRQLQAGLWPNPRLGYSGEEIRGGAFGGGEQGAFVEQAIILGGKLRLNRDIVEQEIRQSEAIADAQLLRVRNGVRMRYYEALAAQERVETITQLRGIASAAAQFSGQLFNIGQQNETEVANAEIDADAADLELVAAEQMRQGAMRALAAVAGDPQLEEAVLDGNLEEQLPDLDEQEFVKTLLQRSPEVRLAQRGVARAEVALARARRESVPDLFVRAGVQQNNQRLEPSGRSVGLQSFAEIGVDLRVFDRNQGNVRAAEAELERTRQELRRVDLVLRDRAAAFLQGYRTARVVVDRYRTQMLPRAQRAYEAIYHRHGLMQASFPQVWMAQQMLYRLHAQYITALERFHVHGVAIEGLLLTDGLEAPARAGEIDSSSGMISPAGSPSLPVTTPPR